MTCALSVRQGGSSRRRRGNRTHDSVDGVAAAELFYGDLASSGADYRAVGLSDLRRGTASTPTAVTAADTGCTSCLSREPSKQRTVVCTVQNTRTATLVHRLDTPTPGTCGQRCQYGYATDGTGRVSGQPKTPGRASTYSGKQELYCHSPYCIYATSGTSRRLQTFKSQALAAAPDVAVYGSARRKKDSCADEDRPGDDGLDGEETAEVRRPEGDVAERWLRGDGDERLEPAEARSQRSSDDLAPPASPPGVTARRATDVLEDILGLAAPSTPPVATSVDDRRVFNSSYNDHIASANNNNFNNNNVAS